MQLLQVSINSEYITTTINFFTNLKGTKGTPPLIVQKQKQSIKKTL